MTKTYFLSQLKQKAEKLLDAPGVYRMLDLNGRILYVGKSIHIRTRVMSYLRPDGNRSRKISRMINYLADFEVYYTDTELDALLLECQWIKQYKPSYNTVLTRQNKYVYLDFYEKGYPKVRLGKKNVGDAQKRIGPFTNHKLAKKAYGYMKLRSGESWEMIYQDIISPDSDIEERIKKQMLEASEVLAFEKAGMYFEQLKGVKYLRMMTAMTQNANQTFGIWKCDIAGTCFEKYYVIARGLIYKTQVTYRFLDKQVIQQLVASKHEWSVGSDEVAIEAIDQLLIIQGALRKGVLQEVYKIT